jgi:YfiH family protein
MTLPVVSPSFQWIEQPWGAALRCRPLAAVAPHVFSTRQLQLSGPADERLLARAVGAERLASLTQVHGNAVVVIRRSGGSAQQDPPYDSTQPGRPRGRPDADALVSDDPGIAIAVRAADCVPLLMADRVRGVIAAVHAGWRGTCARAVVVAVDALEREFGTRPEDIVVAIGPSIGPCCYEVGSELVDAFAAAGHPRHLIDRWFHAPPPARGTRDRPRLRLDVAGANRDQLLLAGVDDAQIHMSGLCTAMHLDVLTSYRVEKEKAGRLVAAIRCNR